jgi:Mg2+-importing ATPase
MIEQLTPRQAAGRDSAQVLAAYETSLAGLTEEEAAQRRQQFGDNRVTEARPIPWWEHLWKSFNGRK